MIHDYIASLDALAAQQELPSIDHLYRWLGSVADQFGIAYQATMGPIGLKSLVTEGCQYREILK